MRRWAPAASTNALALSRASVLAAACSFSLPSLAQAPAANVPPLPAASAATGGVASANPAVDAGSVADAAASSSPSLDDSAQARTSKTSATCVERVPEGKARPRLTQSLPLRALSGHAIILELQVEHGKGETVLPTGFELQPASPEQKALERAGFRLPHPEGGAGPSVTKADPGASDTTTTTVKIPFLILPEKPGRQELTLPPLPIAIARASGDVISLCTEPHTLTVEDPIADTPNPLPREGLEGRRQLEVWTAAKYVTIAALIALVAGALLAWLVGKWRSRPKPAVPPPPPRPAWEVAFESLARIRAAGLVAEERFGEHFDQVSDAIRKYLGDQYGFDGLESTTRETLIALRPRVPPIAVLPDIEAFLREADLVKFARITPTAEDCARVLERGETIVQTTMHDVPLAKALAPEPALLAPTSPDSPSPTEASGATGAEQLSLPRTTTPEGWGRPPPPPPGTPVAPATPAAASPRPRPIAAPPNSPAKPETPSGSPGSGGAA